MNVVVSIEAPRRPGALVHEGTDDPTMLLIGDSAPDRVRLPPELGGRELRVEGSQAPCPQCRGDHAVTHLALTDRYGVAECPRCGFVWYREKANQEACP